MLVLLFYLITIASTNGLKLDLIHRHPSISPQQNLLISASNYRAIKLLHQKTEVQTPVVPSEGDYLVKISVGTPPFELLAAASLAYDLTWFQCKPCDRCYQQSSPIFNLKLSKTYRTLPCDSRHCSEHDREHISCNRKYNECGYRYSYGNSTSTTMRVMGSDVFSFADYSEGETWEHFNSTFGCGFDQSGLFDKESSGLMGLGDGPLSIVSQMGPRIGYKFSYCLAPPNSNHTNTIRFGSTFSTGQQSITTTTAPFTTSKPQSFYNLKLTGISIGSKTLKLSEDIIIDIGIALTYLNPTLFSRLKVMVNSIIGAKPLPEETPSESMLCYDSKAAALTPPDIVFDFSGRAVTFKAENLFFESNGVICLPIVMSERDDDPMVLGNMAQINLMVEYDLTNKTVSFAQMDCAHDNQAE